MKEKTVKYKIGIGLVLFFLIVGVPIIVNFLFKIKTVKNFWVAEWSAGEFLSYYGSVLSFCTTAFLSALALWQNEIIRQESDKHTRQLEKMEIQKNSPFFSARLLNRGLHDSNLEVELRNISQNPAIDINNIVVKIEKGNDLCNTKEIMVLKDYLFSNDVLIINLENSFLDVSKRLSFQFECKDIYGNVYNFTLHFINKNSKFLIKRVLK